jgi:ketosteroid isomerase-like protein
VGPSAADVTVIRQIDSQLTGFVLRANWPGLQALFADNAVLMPPGASTIAGAAAVAEWYASASGTLHEFTTTVEAIGGSGNLAVNRGTYMVVRTPLGETQPVTERGNYLRVLQRQPDGSWRITASMWN